MPIYANIGGVQKEQKPWYANVGGAQKTLTNQYANVGGAQKAIYTAQKYHWWRRYDVTSWAQQSFTNYNTGNSEGDNYISSGLSGYYAYSSYSFNTSTGIYTLSGRMMLSWYITGSDEYSTYYSLNSSCIGSYVVSLWGEAQTTGTALYQIINGNGVDLTDWGEQYVVQLSNGKYRKPSAHASGYTLVQGGSATSPPINANYNLGNGYAYQNVYGDSYGLFNYEGHYWSYDGYY